MGSREGVRVDGAFGGGSGSGAAEAGRRSTLGDYYVLQKANREAEVAEEIREKEGMS